MIKFSAVLLLVLLGLVFTTGLFDPGIPLAEQTSNSMDTDGQAIAWVEHRIDDEALAGGVPLRGADGLQIADLDRDGLQDIVSVHEDSGHIRLAFGVSHGRWESVTLIEGGMARGAEDVAIADINGDGWLDLLVACEDGNILYFQNPGENARVPSNWAYVTPKITHDRGSWIRVFAADLNKDGHLEMIATNKGKKMYAGKGPMGIAKTAVSWFDIPANPLDADAWQEHELGRYVVPINSRPIDIDDDGDLDIIAGSRGEARMILFENNGANPVAFTEHKIEPDVRRFPQTTIRPKMFSGMMMAFADLNHDGRKDIVTFESPYSIVWLEQPEHFGETWKNHPLTNLYPDAPIALTLADINGNGRLDLLTGGYSQDPREQDEQKPEIAHSAGGIYWLEQGEDPLDTWTRHGISRRTRGMFDAFIPRDINEDGLIDFIGTRGNSGEYDGVFWLEQTRSQYSTRRFIPARKEESRELPAASDWLRCWQALKNHLSLLII
jgi:hypothetical protein